MPAKKNILNKQFGKLKVIEDLGSLNTCDGLRGYWRCLCECGKKVNLTTRQITNKYKKLSNETCCSFCYKFIPFTKKNHKNEKHGSLTILEEIDSIDPKNYRTTWSAKCDCGKTTKITTNQIKNKSKLHCGCGQTKNSRTNILSPLERSQRKVFSSLYTDGDLLFEDFLSMTQLPCYYCGRAPFRIFNYFKSDSKRFSTATEFWKKLADTADFIYNRLDRVNSLLPHNKNNLVPCCWECNTAKSNLSQTDFLSHIEKIYLFLFKEVL